MNKASIILSALTLFACQSNPTENVEYTNAKSHEEIKEYLSQYEPYEMTFDARGYDSTDKEILKKLVTAAEYLDTAYWMQTSKAGLRM
ncbi:MAG: hypothetical protein GY816_21805, partial [Cytophagales bacterium]|nr:hypothetical protein [Cytophagales bacterium]